MDLRGWRVPVSAETCAEMPPKPGRWSIAGMRSTLLSLLAVGLAGCEGLAAEDYRAFVEEDRLLVCSVEAVLALPAVSREHKI
jgi:hypothetical protein